MHTGLVQSAKAPFRTASRNCQGIVWSAVGNGPSKVFFSLSGRLMRLTSWSFSICFYPNVYLSLSVSVSVYLFLSVCLSVYRSISFYLFIFYYPSTWLSIHLFTYVSIYGSTDPSIDVSIYLSMCLSVYLSIFPSIWTLLDSLSWPSALGSDAIYWRIGRKIPWEVTIFFEESGWVQKSGARMFHSFI